MPRLFSTHELEELKDLIRRDIEEGKPRLVVCAGTACQAGRSNNVIRAAKRRMLADGLLDRISLRVTGCHGFCEMGPVVIVEPKNTVYTKVEPDDVGRIIDAVLSDSYVEDKLYVEPSTGERHYSLETIPFFKSQQRTLIGQNKQIDPIRLFDYLAIDGYSALEKALTALTPEEIIDEVARAGLRGRGGAGFPTATKWRLARQQGERVEKYVVCNADEGDPGAYMDRSILEGNPHSVIEGMVIGGLAMAATHGYVFVRHEYPLAVKNLMIALREARHTGLIGENILGTGFDFDIEIVQSAGAFVCGEETALIRSIEGFMGEPRQRPPYPIEKGIHGKPTCINNVETWANVPIILTKGAEEYAKVGTEKSTGTKVFSLVGKVQNSGLVEVPMGITINQIVHEIGGGPLDGAKIKAVQIGGPSGGCVPHWKFDLPIDYDSLTEAGAIMGSGGLIVLDDNSCMVDVAKYFMAFLKDESCGKCLPCREGTKRMYEILDDISSGRGTLAQLDLLEELAMVVKDTTMCGLGQSAPNPVLSTLRYFRSEYERHIVDRRCDAYVCKDLVGAPCQSACPVGTEAWRYVALIANGEYEEAYRVIRAPNPFPSVCARVCDAKCESRCRLSTTGEDPVAIRELKRFVTDRVDPSEYRAQPRPPSPATGKKVAVVGAGPAGLAAAHELSLDGCKVTLFEAEDRPGGMLVSGIPTFRLPRRVLEREIAALIDDNVTLRCNTALGEDFTIDGLFDDGFEAVFVALGSHRSRPLRAPGEDAGGVFPSIQFLKAWNLRGENLAKGKVGVIGGGNSAIDAARVAIRQKGVDSVSILYRRTRHEMPAYEEEIEAALEEGISLTTLLSPVEVVSEDGAITGIKCIRNQLGELDSSGRRSPQPIPGTEHVIPIDTLVVAIGEQPDIDHLIVGDTPVLEGTDWGTLKAEPRRLTTQRAGVFAGGDVVTGPNTVIDAIAAGKRAALMIRRYLCGQSLDQPEPQARPSVHIPPRQVAEGVATPTPRVAPHNLPPDKRRCTFDEAVLPMAMDQAQKEATRCLRCDLDFTKAARAEGPQQMASGGKR